MPVSLYQHLLGLNKPHDGCLASKPASDVERIIDCFLFFEHITFPAEVLAYNDGIPTLVFFAKPAVFTFVKEEERQQVEGAYLSTQLLNNAYIQPVRHVQSLFIVRFRPETFYSLVPFPLQSLQQKIAWTPEELWGGDGSILQRQAAKAGLHEKIRLVEDFVRRQAAVFLPENHVLEQVIRQISQQKGTLPIQQVKPPLPVGYKWLERHFLQCLGLSPKAFSRLQRFIHAYFQLMETRDLLRVSLDNGFYDQNHLGKEFKFFTGKSPMAYLKIHADA